MKTYGYGRADARDVLIQPVGDHDLPLMEKEAALISAAGYDFRICAVKTDSWNDDLSPWAAPAVFGNEGFGGRAEDTLEFILGLCTDKSCRYHIGGYSLAGLFALWAAYRTDVFTGAAAASPSVWFPQFTEFMADNRILCKKVYLSLGDREEHTKNPVMAAVGSCIRRGYDIISGQGIPCCLEWNSGGHFRDADIRTAKAFSWLLG